MYERTLTTAARWVLRLGLGGLILATGVGKALDVGGFVDVLQRYDLALGDTVLGLVAPLISTLEIALGAWILSGFRLRLAMWGAIVLNAGYCAILTSALLRGLDLQNCGCFGVFFAQPLRWYSPLEDLALIAAALALLLLTPDELRARAALLIHAPRERVVAIYRDFARWPSTFPTIRGTRVLHDDGHAQVIEVDHRKAGRVINVLSATSPTDVELREFKRKYTARFINRFEAVPEGTLYTVTAEIRPCGLWRLVSGPWLDSYVRSRIAHLVLEPVRKAAESRASPSGTVAGRFNASVLSTGFRSKEEV